MGITLLYAMILHMFLKTRYIIDDEKLIIKTGFIRYKPKRYIENSFLE